ncbi:MAG: cupin [Chloroflexota bacterium]
MLMVTRWDKPQPPTEAELIDLFRAEGLEPYRWSNGPGDVYPVHAHPYHKVLYVVRGSITFRFPGGQPPAELKVGDRLDLPAGVEHDAVVGPEGVVCLEAHRPARKRPGP